jgi:membrane associated rhomboid family serine protease
VQPSREPILNVPGVIALLIAAFCVVHGVRWMLDQSGQVEVLLLFAFIPARYDPEVLAQAAAPGGLAADAWTFVTYAFIHGDLTHLTVNSLWLLAFGSPLAVRFGTLKILAFLAVGAAAGAAVHLATHPGTFTPMVGASAAISAAMAGVIRFLFEPGGPMGAGRLPGPAAHLVPASPLMTTLARPPVLLFLAVWFGLNIIFGLGTLPISDEGISVAWEAHIGGFVAGLILFGLFDPVGRR